MPLSVTERLSAVQLCNRRQLDSTRRWSADWLAVSYRLTTDAAAAADDDATSAVQHASVQAPLHILWRHHYHVSRRPEVVYLVADWRSPGRYRRLGRRRWVSMRVRPARCRNPRTGNSCRATSGFRVPRDAARRRWFVRRRSSSRRMRSGSMRCSMDVRRAWRTGYRRADTDTRHRRSGRRGSSGRVPPCTARRISAAHQRIRTLLF